MFHNVVVTGCDMRCLSPLVAWRRRDRAGVTLRFSEGDSRFGLKLPCGSCVACLLDRARQHAVRCWHERSLHERACFVTLTYDDEHLPYGGSLVKEHFQRFMRDLREEVVEPVRFFGCGEYGGRGGRPHYHAILFGCDFGSDRYVCGSRSGLEVYRSRSLERVWRRGRSEIGTAGFDSAAYVAGYVAEKLGERALVGREPEFLLCSLKPGIGRGWFDLHWREVYARDSVVVQGREMAPPRAYDKWMQGEHPEQFVRVRRGRMERRASRYAVGEDPDDCSSRWDVIEECLKARLNFYAREVES